MTFIVKADEGDFQLLADIGKRSYIESHGSSAAAQDINMYVAEKYNNEEVKKELADHENIYHIISYDKKPAGYSKIIFDSPYSNIQFKDVTKLERLYLLKEFYSLKLGFELLEFNIELSKQNNQSGMWLFVWKENHRAVNFYKKYGFEIIGSYDFPITEAHSNPNHQMLLKY
ncbi:MAG: GNAT family N-acetyltransferase [Chitinophagaceae bacterium]|nr:GNAT family N-acetyltransferase [Chitinophagaceae bacterium]